MAARPMVSCLMVTRDRSQLARRALECLVQQTYRPVELVVVDSSREPMTTFFEAYRDYFPIRYENLPPQEGLFLGHYRNVSLELARGEVITQWDDDDWYHPQRLELQLNALLKQEGFACFLRRCLVHLDTAPYREHPYRADSGDGVPGSVLARRSSVRYPNQPRSEDLVYQHSLRGLGKVTLLRESHLFIRCYHGANTWDQKHFLGKLRKGILGRFHSSWANLRGDLRLHPWFQLDPEEVAAFAQFAQESRRLDLMQ